MSFDFNGPESFPWIVSVDTLRSEDLLPRFWGIADQLGASIPSPVLASLELLVGEDSSEDSWNDEQASETLAEMFDILQSVAPAGFYFGSSDGDGACFGYWLSEDWAEALEAMGIGEDDPTGWASLIAELDADGIDPERIEDAYVGRAEGYSEERAGADYAMELFEDSGLRNSSCDGWPFNCIDWDAAWRELELGDGYRLHDIGGGDWLVFRNY